MEATYAVGISQLEEAITELTTQVDEIAVNIFGVIMKLKNNSELTTSNGISRANIVLLIKHVVVLSKETIAVDFSL